MFHEHIDQNSGEAISTRSHTVRPRTPGMTQWSRHEPEGGRSCCVQQWAYSPCHITASGL